MPKTRAYSQSTRMQIRRLTRPGVLARLSREAAARAARHGRCRGSSARPRSSSARSTWATTSSGPQSMDCGTEGRLGHLPRLLSLYSCMAARRGDWDVAITAGEEARRLAEEFAEPAMGSRGRHGASHSWPRCAATSRAPNCLAARAEAVAEPAGANITMAFAQFGKVLAALATGRHTRRIRIRRATVRSRRLGIPPRNLILADRGSR